MNTYTTCFIVSKLEHLSIKIDSFHMFNFPDVHWISILSVQVCLFCIKNGKSSLVPTYNSQAHQLMQLRYSGFLD